MWIIKYSAHNSSCAHWFGAPKFDQESSIAMAEAEAAPMAMDAPEQKEEETAEVKATPASKKDKAKPDKAPTTKDSDKKQGIYDASPVIEGKRERKKVERLEVVVPIKSPEPTVKQVRAPSGRAHPLRRPPHAAWEWAEGRGSCSNPCGAHLLYAGAILVAGQGHQAG